MGKKRILIVSDGVAGNYKKSNAIAELIRKRFPAEVVWLHLRLRTRLFRHVLPFLLNQTHRVPGPERLRLFYRIASDVPPRPDLIVSSGNAAGIASAWLATYHRCPNICVGELRSLDKRYFSRIVVIPSTRQADGKQIESLAATEIDPDVVAQAASAFLKATGLPARRRWTLVLGGDGDGYVYSNADWEQLRATACHLAATNGIRWLVTTSRRTSPAAEQIFASPTMKAWADDVLIYNHDRRPLYNAFLGCAEVIVCTEDSRNMLTESVASGRPVLSVRPAKAKPHIRSQALVRHLEAAGYLKSMTTGQLDTESVQEFLARYQVPRESIMQPAQHQVDEFLTTLSWAA